MYEVRFINYALSYEKDSLSYERDYLLCNYAYISAHLLEVNVVVDGTPLMHVEYLRMRIRIS